MNRRDLIVNILRIAFVLITVFLCRPVLQAQDEDGGMSHDNRGNEYLESIYVPEVPNAPSA